MEIGTKESFEYSLLLCRAGLMAGPSSGFALAGLIDFIRGEKESGRLHDLKNKSGEVIAVFICPDGPLPYLEEYFEYLDESRFPKIENEYLLMHKPDNKRKKKSVAESVNEIKAEDAYTMAYPVSQKALWRAVNEEKEIPLDAGVLIVDVRTDQEFEHFHLPGSRHIELRKLSRCLPSLQKEAKKKKVLFVCKTGNRSGIATQLARSKKIDALNLAGGMTEWSRLGLPRVRPKICIDNSAC